MRMEDLIEMFNVLWILEPQRAAELVQLAVVYATISMQGDIFKMDT